MKQCTNCGHSNSDDWMFCEQCGAQLSAPLPAVPDTKICSACGAALRKDAMFCEQCGTPQNTDVPTAEALLPGTAVPQNPAAPWSGTVPPNAAPWPAQTKKKPTAMIAVVVSIVVLILAAAGGGLFYMYQERIYLFADSKEDKEEDVAKKKEEVRSIMEAEDEEYTDEEERETPTPAAKNPQVNRTKPIKIPVQVSASSELAGGGYGPANLIDSDADTAWVEGVAGTGIGEYVLYKLKSTDVVYGIAIMPGCLQSSELFAANSMPVTLTIKAGSYEENIDLSRYTCDFNNVGGSMMYVDLKESVEADEVVITIKDTKLGQKDDTYISELYLYTYPEKGRESAYSAQSWEAAHTEAAADYVLPDSNSRYLTKEDLAGLTQEQCRIARNELYARYGRMFDDEELQAYFNGCAWYHGTIPAAQFSESMLNDFEIANRDLIVEYEKEQGYR